MKLNLRPYIDHIVIIVLAVVCYVMFFHKLGGLGLLGPDEPRYAAVAREMFMTGDFITPRLHGEPWFEKPVLMYWLAALGYAIFGVGEIGARFPSALSATICVFLIYWFVRRLWDRTLGFLAALVLATSVGWLAFARAASMDMPLSASLTAALAFFLLGFNEDGPRRKTWFYWFYACLGLGVLAKGPIAIALPAVSLAAFLLVRGRLQDWRTWHPKGLWITAAVALPWYLIVTVVNGWEFINVFFINHNLQRFATTVHGHERPFYFYLPVLLLLTFPWTVLLISALRRSFGRNEQILAWWAIVPFVLFSLSGSKLPGYILPVVPPIAILCAKELWQVRSATYKVAVFIEAGMMVFIGIAFGFFGNMLNVDPHVSGTLIVWVTSVIAVLLSIIALWLRPPVLAGFNAVVMLTVVIVATNFVFPRFEASDTMRPWEAALNRLVPENQVVFMYKPARWVEYSVLYYRFNRARGLFSPEELIEVTSKEPRVLCISNNKTLIEELTHLTEIDIQVVQEIGNHSAFWVWQAK
ncbi:MAG: glycosyltransferase family 39 protein [Acidobacteria bacterium]|nr:glycosyltransferase family 39 protein [Acidobacteriota bacterium]